MSNRREQVGFEACAALSGMNYSEMSKAALKQLVDALDKTFKNVYSREPQQPEISRSPRL
jgi:hypothetical protein